VLSEQTEFISILQQHLVRYPLAEAQDLLKLAYQNEFAGGHLVTNAKDSLRRLKSELDDLTCIGDLSHRSDLLHRGDSAYRGGASLFEDIGRGLCRMNLAGLAESGLDLATANQFFVITAQSVRGHASHFRSTLLIMRQFLATARPQILPELDQLLADYDFSTCPPISHSAAYRQHYRPAYRIVLTNFRDALAVFIRIDQLLKRQAHTIAGIDGMCGSGKSTLAALIRKTYHCALVPMDHFFLPLHLRTPERLQEPGGNVDYERFIIEVLPHLEANQAFDYHRFNCSTMSFDKTIQVKANRLSLVEGTYCLHPNLESLYDLKIMTQISPEEQERRIRKRNTAKMARRFMEEWIPLENRYFSATQLARRCDLVVQTS
jgi:uridine kinase